MKPLIEKYGEPNFANATDSFSSLAKIIIYQQLSGKAAKAIYNRWLCLFDNKIPSCEDVNKIEILKFKNIGLSNQKAIYIKSLAEYFLKYGNNITFKNLTDNQVYDELIKIKGIGRWTIDMFLMFTLFRLDIFPLADLGIQKGIKKLFNLQSLPSEEYMLDKAKDWQPYRSIASWYLWRTTDDEEVW